ncbi:signal peptidase II [Candidatus Falkowbacteria bacterium]|nr:signal peptidase II [Candidatus Falkowbacteria bacterium]
MQIRYKTTAVFLAVVFLFMADRWLKSLAMAGFSREIIGYLLVFDFSKNFGIAFSLPFPGHLLPILVGSIILILTHFARLAYLQQDFFLVSAYVLIIGGSISNLFDRLRYGFVVDYLEVAYFSILNVADMMIFCGVLWLLILFHKKRPTTG